jgi:hypothetical protein
LYCSGGRWWLYYSWGRCWLYWSMVVCDRWWHSRYIKWICRKMQKWRNNEV